MRLFYIFSVLFTLLLIISCGEKEENKQALSAGTQSVAANNPDGLSDFEMTNGIGPVKNPLFLGAVNKALAAQGEKSFATKCASCHKLDERYIGPALRYVASRRSNEFILNQILNPDENVKRHPMGKKLLAEYIAPMTFQNVSLDEAKSLLDYLRFMAEEGRTKNIPEVPVFSQK